MIEQIKARTNNKEIQTWIDGPLTAYIKRNKISEDQQGHLEHVIDYLENRPKPLRLRKMSVRDAIKLAEQWTKRLEKKGQNIKESKDDVKVIKTFKNGFTIVKLIGENAFLREGNLMRHCVGSYVKKEGVEIFSLRDPMNNPHATFELVKENKNISQVKGKGNGPIHPDYIDMVIAFLKKVGMQIQSSEMLNLGYHLIDNDFKKEIESFYGKNYFKYFKLGKYVYLDVNQIKKLG